MCQGRGDNTGLHKHFNMDTNDKAKGAHHNIHIYSNHLYANKIWKCFHNLQ